MQKTISIGKAIRPSCARALDYGSGGLWFMSYGEPNKAPKNLIPKHQTIFLVSL